MDNTPFWMTGLTTVLGIIVIVGLMFANANREPQRMQECYQRCRNVNAPSWSYNRRTGCSCGGTTE